MDKLNGHEAGNGGHSQASPVDSVNQSFTLDNIDYIMGIMTKNRIRHIPIVTDGKLSGIISIGDMVKAQLQSSEYENKYLKDYLFGGG
jgi:signal-transduction protein with cAMP-binding, CBS, and nucleotidyltransferase domain